MQNLEFRRFAEIVRLAVQHDCRLVVFVHPYHANYLEMLHQLGFWASFEDWKRALVQLVDRVAGPRRGFVRIYDFSDYNEFTTEPVPAAGDTRTAMQWYWEQGHYKSRLGDLIIAQIVGKGRDFGEELDSSDIESDLQRIDRDRELFSSKRSLFGTNDPAASR